MRCHCSESHTVKVYQHFTDTLLKNLTTDVKYTKNVSANHPLIRKSSLDLRIIIDLRIFLRKSCDFFPPPSKILENLNEVKYFSKLRNTINSLPSRPLPQSCCCFPFLAEAESRIFGSNLFLILQSRMICKSRMIRESILNRIISKKDLNQLSLSVSQKNSNKIRITNHWFGFATSPNEVVTSARGSDPLSPLRQVKVLIISEIHYGCNDKSLCLQEVREQADNDEEYHQLQDVIIMDFQTTSKTFQTESESTEMHNNICQLMRTWSCMDAGWLFWLGSIWWCCQSCTRHTKG